MIALRGLVSANADRVSRLVFQLLCLGLIVHYQVAWMIVFSQAEEDDVWQRDWYYLWRAATQFANGDWGALYATDFTAGYFWLYPPYALYLVAPLSLLPPAVAYGALVLLEIVALGVSILLLRRLLGADHDWLTFVAGTVASAAFTSVVVIGQSSALLMLAIVAGATLLAVNRPVLGGLALAFLGLKPNWVLVFVGMLAVTRRWSALATVAAAGALMIASTLPLGASMWAEFFASTRGVSQLILERYQPYMLVTVHAFWRSVLPGGWGIAGVLTAITLVPMVAALFSVWVTQPRDVARQVGATVLFTMSANVYTNFYDALLLVVPAAVWWTGHHRYSSSVWWAIGLLLSAIWVWQWVSVYGWKDDAAISWAGPLIAGWLVLDGWDAWRRRGSVN